MTSRLQPFAGHWAEQHPKALDHLRPHLRSLPRAAGSSVLHYQGCQSVLFVSPNSAFAFAGCDFLALQTTFELRKSYFAVHTAANRLELARFGSQMGRF